MPLSCNWPTKVITIPLSELTLVSGTYYTLDVVYYFQLLRELNGSVDGIAQTIGFPLYNNTSPTTGTPRIVDIINGYTIQFENGAYSVDFINGNTNWRAVEIRNDVSVGTNNTAALIDPEALQAATFLGGLLGISISPATGKDIGTPIPGNGQYPVKTEARMHELVLEKGFDNIFVKDNLFLELNHTAGHTFIGKNAQLVQITIGDVATYPLKNVSNCKFKDVWLNGELDSSNEVRECVVGNIQNANGFIYECTIAGIIEVSDNISVQSCFISPYAVEQTAYIDFKGLAKTVIISNWAAGRIVVSNMVTGSFIGMAGMGGYLVPDATNTGGTVAIGGASILDETEIARVDSVNHVSIAEQVWTVTVEGQRMVIDIDDLHTFQGLNSAVPVAVARNEPSNITTLTAGGEILTITPTDLTRTP